MDRTDTPEFRKWFGKSVVKNFKTGRPIPMYHGTDNTFSQFETSRSNDGGIYFSPNPKTGSHFAYGLHGDAQVKICYLRLIDPVELTPSDVWGDDLPENGKYDPSDVDWSMLEMHIHYAKDEGHDGMILRGFAEVDGTSHDQYVIFSPNQAKSVYNKGTWSLNSNNLSENQSPEKNQQLQSDFLSHLRTVDPAYSKLFICMVNQEPIVDVMKKFGWHSLQSLRNKVDAMKDLYLEFRGGENVN